MQAQMKVAAAVAGLAAVAATVVTGMPPAQASGKGEPKIRQMVVFRSGKLVSGSVVAKRTSVKVGRKTCAVAAATPLAALLTAKPGKIGFRDYGACSKRPADSSGLFVKSLRGETNRAQDGWVYKVGRRLGTAGAADPSGPFGSGRLRGGDEVVWFYCRQFATGSCQRSLEVVPARDGDRVTVSVTGYDDAGDGRAVAGAAVHAGKASADTDGDGKATLTLKPGVHEIYATKKGAIRSFVRKVK